MSDFLLPPLPQQLTGERATPDHSASLLDQYFSNAQQTTTVLLADEVIVYVVNTIYYELIHMYIRIYRVCLIPLSTIVIHTFNLCKVQSMDDNCGEWVECMGVASGCGEQEVGVASGSG